MSSSGNSQRHSDLGYANYGGQWADSENRGRELAFIGKSGVGVERGCDDQSPLEEAGSPKCGIFSLVGLHSLCLAGIGGSERFLLRVILSIETPSFWRCRSLSLPVRSIALQGVRTALFRFILATILVEVVMRLCRGFAF